MSGKMNLNGRTVRLAKLIFKIKIKIKNTKAQNVGMNCIKEVHASSFMSKHKKNVRGSFLDLPAT